MNSWQTKSSKVVYKNPWLVVYEDQVVRPDGNDGIYGYISSNRGNSVYIVPVEPNGDTYIVGQERYVTKQISWEIPAGANDDQTYEEAAKRELLEETGLSTSSVTIINEFYAANGVADLKGAVCLATSLQKVTEQLDEVDGILGVRRLPLTEVRDMIMRGEINDGPTITAVLTVMAYLEQHPLTTESDKL